MTWGFVSCGPNQVMVVSGCCHSRPLLVPGGRVFVWPMINKIQYLSLNILPINLESSQVMSHDSIQVTIKSTAQVKIINKKTDLRNACSVFLGMNIDSMADFLRNTIEGHQRSVIGKFTVEEIYFKRDLFVQQVTNCAFNDLSDMGITLVSLSVNEVTEDEGLIASLLEKKSAENQANLRIAQAEAKLECISEKVTADEEVTLKKASLASNALSMMADLQLAKLNNDIEISKALASADLAGNLTAIKNSQVMKEHELQLKELEANVALLNAETDVKLVQLDVLKTLMDSSSNLQAVETTARANNFHDVTKAFADAQVIRLKGSIDADSLVTDERKVLAQEFQSNFRRLSQALAALTPSPSASYFADGKSPTSLKKQGTSNLDNSTSSVSNWGATVTDETGQPSENAASISSRSSFTSSILFTLDKLASSFLRTASAADDISTGGLTPSRYSSTPNSPYSLRQPSISEEEAVALKSTVDPQFSVLSEFEESNLLKHKDIPNALTDVERGNDLSLENEETAVVADGAEKRKNIRVTDSSQRTNDDLQSEKNIISPARATGEEQNKLPLLNESLTTEVEKKSNGDNDDEMNEFSSLQSQTIGDDGNDGDGDGDDDDSTLVSLSESTETEPVLLKVSHVIGINLTNAILSTVFHEFLVNEEHLQENECSCAKASRGFWDFFGPPPAQSGPDGHTCSQLIAPSEVEMDSLKAVDIDTGRFKYVLIQVKDGDKERYLVRGNTSAGYHADVFEKCEDEELRPLKKQLKNLKWECVGGGRIIHHPNKKTINIFGYSQGFGRADHSISCDLVKQAYPEYSSIEWSNEGY